MAEPTRRQPSRRTVLVGAALAATSAALPMERGTAATRPAVRFGINYTPSKHWWYLWQRWDPARVEYDLGQIAALGVDHIRIQALWSVFEPARGRVSQVMLNRLRDLLDMAGSHHLDVCVSVLSGFLSGKKFIPSWVRGNLATYGADVAGELSMFRAVGRTIGRHGSLLGFDVGNELLGHFRGASTPALQAWCDELVAASRSAAPGRLHSVSGLSRFLADYPRILTTSGDVSVVHPWYFYRGAVDRRGRLTPAAARHAELNVEYVKSFHDFDPGVPRRGVWVQEVGAPDSTIPTARHPDFVVATMRNTLSCEDVYGITWWDSHDIDAAALPQFSPPESTLGLIDVKGKLKPAGHAFEAEIARWRKGISPAPVTRSLAVANTGADLWHRLSVEGARPAMVPAERVDDLDYLALRGITRVVDSA